MLCSVPQTTIIILFHTSKTCGFARLRVEICQVMVECLIFIRSKNELRSESKIQATSKKSSTKFHYYMHYSEMGLNIIRRILYNFK